jgi:hypothetical protein
MRQESPHLEPASLSGQVGEVTQEKVRDPMKDESMTLEEDAPSMGKKV